MPWFFMDACFFVVSSAANDLLVDCSFLCSCVAHCGWARRSRRQPGRTSRWRCHPFGFDPSAPLVIVWACLGPSPVGEGSIALCLMTRMLRPLPSLVPAWPLLVLLTWPPSVLHWTGRRVAFWYLTWSHVCLPLTVAISSFFLYCSRPASVFKYCLILFGDGRHAAVLRVQ